MVSQAPPGRQPISYVFHLCNKGRVAHIAYKKFKRFFSPITCLRCIRPRNSLCNLLGEEALHVGERSVVLGCLIPKISVVSNGHADDTNTEDVYYYTRSFV